IHLLNYDTRFTTTAICHPRWLLLLCTSPILLHCYSSHYCLLHPNLVCYCIASLMLAAPGVVLVSYWLLLLLQFSTFLEVTPLILNSLKNELI
ncbi:60S acidic ribosomal protein P1-3, partial [Bienertia sinuspersici]